MSAQRSYSVLRYLGQVAETMALKFDAKQHRKTERLGTLPRYPKADSPRADIRVHQEPETTRSGVVERRPRDGKLAVVNVV
jgi:hypothetical protein